jgi:hypothetical protein
MMRISLNWPVFLGLSLALGGCGRLGLRRDAMPDRLSTDGPKI